MTIHSLHRDELLARLETGEAGLTAEEARRRLAAGGPNEIQKKERKNYPREYLRQYVQFFAVLLEVAAVLSFLADGYAPGEGYDILGYAVLGAVVINATFAFWQEYKADRTIEALLRLMPSMVTVRRDNAAATVDAREVVPGDILLLEEGDRIAADAVLIEAHSLYVDMATLTGESRPKKRVTEPSEAKAVLEAKNAVFAGTTVLSGNGSAAVYATGQKTEFGRIASLAREVKKRPTPMQLEIVRITRILTVAAILVGGVFFVLGYLAGFGVLVAAIFALSLIVANVPEGMLPTITLSLSLASQNMANRNALIKNLDSVQTLGSTTVVCTDKTGTLTRNEMTAKEIFLAGGETVTITGEGYLAGGEFTIRGERPGVRDRLDFFLRAGLLNCRAMIEDDTYFGDPTELAIVAAARKAGVGPGDYEKVEEIPFSSERKMMSTITEKDGRSFIFTKGAPEVVLGLVSAYVDGEGRVVPFDEGERERVLARADEMERAAYRLLAVAYREGEEERDLVFLGLVGLMDLPRAEVYEAIRTCRVAGIRVMVLTGDNPVTARAVAEEIGLSMDRVITGDDLVAIPEADLRDILRTEDVLFARLKSDQKLRIASALQENGEVVAMTGDGVNDAPALKKADIGISMGKKGTEVAKEAADMILIDDNFCSIVAAVEEGRTVYFNIKKFVTYILASNVPEIVPYILQFFFKIPLPLSVIQILSIDLGSDMLPGLALGSERPERDIMKMPPVGKNDRILDREVFKRGYFFLGIIEATAAMTAFLGFLFLSGWQYGDLSISGTELHRQAMTMTLLGAVTCQLANVWTLRSWEFSAFERGLFKNRLLIVAVVLELIWIFLLLNVGAVQVIFNTASVPPPYLLLLVPFPIILFASHEVYKYRIRKRMNLQRSDTTERKTELCGEKK
ncbi:MAG: cation-transporting P-type ATPase [Methanofollis sp.]|uniref:cation-translocating P-type ATPase n=1 Tax=Methanofollis sp. TaxID=2052835 RepID=UPI00262ED1B1|nr:cation-transporting P-type ATPase [Methanofollis sp.]MDD4256035.1 cation-transporting P-type ATPase [Methanofollis sp.]